ncbi:MAG: phosphocholine cytidylyltransferase family protein [Alphaproteobacteria bacterium]
MRAIILAAGRGRRLHPYTADRPKCLIELGGMTLIERQLTVLRGAGIDDIVIATGYRADMLELPDTRQVYNPHWETTNMVETLFCAEAAFGNDIIVTYGDIVFEPRVLAALLASTHEISVVVDRNWRAYWEHRFADPLSDAESLRLDDNGRITDIGNKVSDLEEIQAQYIGLMRYRGKGIDALRFVRAGLGSVHRPWMDERPLRKAYMTDLLMGMILTGHEVHAVEIEGGWLEIDTREDYEKARAMIADGTITCFFNPSIMEVTT